MTKKIIRRIAHVTSGATLAISFPMLCAVSDNATAQIVWTICWAVVFTLSAKVFQWTKATTK